LSAATEGQVGDRAERLHCEARQPEPLAAAHQALRPTDEVDDATWERVFSVNVTGPMRLTRAVLPLMIAAGKGSVVNVASEAALKASAAGAAYTSSKHAIAGYTKSVASFHGPQGIRANAVCTAENHGGPGAAPGARRRPSVGRATR
jgi:NAD(P)-dependent dehydrogenase (short-subunit alcohol dehydrogenase family)